MLSSSRASATVVLTRNPRFPLERPLFALLLLPLLAVPMLVLSGATGLNADAFAALLEKFLHSWKTYAVMLVLIGSLLWHWRLRHRETLRIDAHGISYTPPFAWWPQRAFACAWADIEQLELRPSRLIRSPLLAELQLRSKDRRLILRPLQWYLPRITWAEQQQRRQSMGRDIRSAFVASTLGQLLVDHGQTVTLPPAKPTAFNLLTHPVSRWLVAALFLLIAYAFFDALQIEQRYLEFSPLPTMIGIAVLVAVSATVLLNKTDLPVAEACGLGILLGLSVGAAAYSGLLRVNQLSDWDGAESVAYIRQADGRFLASDFPIIHEDALEPFWDQLPVGQPYAFRLYRGALGFWQLDEEPVNDEMRAFYRAREPR